MGTINVTESDFEQLVENSDIPVLVDFWAEWCGPCKMIAPTIEKISQDFSGKLLVAKVDIDTNPDLSEKYNIRSIPSLLFMNKGAPIEMIVGAVTREMLIDRINQLV